VIDDPKTAEVALDPVRARLLHELGTEPGSAAHVADRIGLTRQKANYHLKLLEQHGLIELAEIRMRGGISERIMRATAAAYIVSPAATAAGRGRPEQISDRLSAAYLIAAAGRSVDEVARLDRAAEAAGQRLPTLTIDTEIGFASAEERAAFADELTSTVVALVARYHHDDGRRHRLVVASHPTPGSAGQPEETT
jgi:DNA-binding transcriptional ArsR family regulator